jgi:hypothetical protein
MLKSLGIAIGVLGWMAQGAAAVERAEFYRVEEHGGAWWFVRPDGERFLSLGVNCVDPGTGRDKYDSTKPSYAGFRHYDTTGAWADDTVGRLKAWNFNTIGGWADPAVQRGQLPYIVVLHLGGSAPWYDLFADEFPQQIEQLTARLVAPRRDDPELLGWCSDNELGWFPDTLFAFHLSQPQTSKTRQRLVALLKSHYGGRFEALAADFVSPDIRSFEELEAGGILQATAGGSARKVILEFTRLLAERYYEIVCGAIRHADPNHLILGDRYMSFCPEEVAKAASRYVDVITTNYDWPASEDGYLPVEYLRRLHTLSGRPVLVTEFYVAADENRSGNPNSGNIFTTVATQSDRAAAVGFRVRQLAREPYVVGAHWFCYADEPPGGRPRDGEDYNFGLIDIENRPYEELVGAMTNANREAAAIHAATNNKSSPPAPLTQTIIPRAPSNPLEGIVSWDKRGNIPPLGANGCAADLLVCWNDDHVYVGVLGLRFIDRDVYAEGLSPTELLELSLAPSNSAESVQLRFGDGNKVSTDNPQVACAAIQDGVRYTAIAALPAAMFDKPRFKAGDEIKFAVTMADPRDNVSTRWKMRIQLD